MNKLNYNSYCILELLLSLVKTRKILKYANIFIAIRDRLGVF